MTVQRLEQAATGTVAGTTVTLVFPPVPQSLVWTGTVTIPSSDLGGNWTAYIGENVASGKVIASWLGRAVYGPLQVWGRERLILVGTGLTTGLLVQAVWRGSSGDESEVDPVSPAPFVSSLSVAQLVAGMITGQTIVIGPGGSIQSSDFVTGVSGWRIDDPGGLGRAEFWNTIVNGLLNVGTAGNKVSIGPILVAGREAITFDQGLTNFGFIYADAGGNLILEPPNAGAAIPAITLQAGVTSGIALTATALFGPGATQRIVSMPAGIAGATPFLQSGSNVLVASGSGDVTVTFPSAFPNTCIACVPVNGDNAALAPVEFSVVSKTAAQTVFRVYNTAGVAIPGGSGMRVDWVAVGY